MNTILLRMSTLAAYVVMVTVNYLAVALPIAGRQTGAISDGYSNLFAPAGYAFSIWGLIYALLGAYVIYQLRQGKNEVVAKVNRLFIVNALLNASWIFAWHYDFIWLSVIIMSGLLFTLIRIAGITREAKLVKKEGWLVRLPFSIYFGWITVATIANVAVFLVSIGWNRFGLSEAFWTIVVLLVGAFIASWRTLKDRSIAYGLVPVWAYTAIIYKHLSVSGFDGKYPNVIWTAALCLLIFVSTILFVSIRKRA